MEQRRNAGDEGEPEKDGKNKDKEKVDEFHELLLRYLLPLYQKVAGTFIFVT